MNTIITLDKSDATTKAVVLQIRADMRGAKNYGAYVAAHSVTRETVKDHAAALAALVYPNAKPVQTVDGKRTPYGNAVQAAAKGLRTALDPIESTPSTALLTTLGKNATLDEIVAAWKSAQTV